MCSRSFYCSGQSPVQCKTGSFQKKAARTRRHCTEFDFKSQAFRQKSGADLPALGKRQVLFHGGRRRLSLERVSHLWWGEERPDCLLLGCPRGRRSAELPLSSEVLPSPRRFEETARRGGSSGRGWAGADRGSLRQLSPRRVVAEVLQEGNSVGWLRPIEEPLMRAGRREGEYDYECKLPQVVLKGRAARWPCHSVQVWLAKKTPPRTSISLKSQPSVNAGCKKQSKQLVLIQP